METEASGISIRGVQITIWVPYGSAVSVWASVASVKFLDGTQITICNPGWKSRMLPFPSVVHSGSSVCDLEIPDASVVHSGMPGGGRDSGRNSFFWKSRRTAPVVRNAVIN